MNVNTKQLNAKAWSRKLVTFNDSQPGQIQISYAGDDGKKRVGYCSLTDIILRVGKSDISVGELLYAFIVNENQLKKQNETLLSEVKALRNEVSKVQEIMVTHFPELMR